MSFPIVVGKSVSPCQTLRKVLASHGTFSLQLISLPLSCFLSFPKLLLLRLNSHTKMFDQSQPGSGVGKYTPISLQWVFQG